MFLSGLVVDMVDLWVVVCPTGKLGRIIMSLVVKF